MFHASKYLDLLKMIFNFPNGNPLLGESIGTSSDFLIFFGVPYVIPVEIKT
jgi:hypothetical protein